MVHDNMHWGTLASALFGCHVPKSRSDLESDMRDLYGRLLSGMDGKKFLKKVKREAKDSGGKWGTLAAALSGVVEVDRSTLSGDTAGLYDELLESYFLTKLKNIYDAQVMGGNWSILAWALYGGDNPRVRSDLDSDTAMMYNQLLETFAGTEDAFLEKLKYIYDAQVMGGNWSVLAWALYGGDDPRVRSDLDSDTAMMYDQIFKTFAGTADAFLAKLKDIYDAQVMGGNWSVLASALHNATPPWSRDSLPTNALISIHDNLRKSFSGSQDAFLQKLKDIYEALVEGGIKKFNNRLGCFKWIDDFDSLFLRILECGGDEGGEMDDEMEKFKTFGHVLEAASIVSQINISSLTQQQISGIVFDIKYRSQYDQAMGLLEPTNAEEKFDEIDVVLKTGMDDENGVKKRWKSLFNRLGQSSDVGAVLRLVYGIKKYRNTQSYLDNMGVQENVASFGNTNEGDY